MRRSILDTSVLIGHWWNCRGGVPLDRVSAATAGEWGRRLIDVEGTDAIVTPVLLEFVCGVRDRKELGLARAYLSPFVAVDRGKVLVADWKEARRMAERVPRSGRPRDFGDCLIRAMASRLGYDVRTFDTGLPR